MRGRTNTYLSTQPLMTMPSRDVCDLCGVFCGPKYAKSKRDRWKGVVQELRVDQTGKLIESGIIHYPPRTTTHRMCWNILEKISPRERHDTCWLEKFTRSLHAMRPHLRRVRDQTSPLLLDEELQILLKPPTECHPSGSNRSFCIKKPPKLLDMPLEVVGVIYFFLKDVLDIVNFRLATGLSPPFATWQRIWRKYHDWSWQCDD